MLTPLTVALDWSANSSHTALLAAEGSGFFAAVGLRVTFVEATAAAAPATPLDGVVAGSVDIGVAPCDQVLAEHLGRRRVECVAALVHADISAVCVLDGSPIQRAGDLLGARYGSCGYPLELEALAGMIEADGGGAGGVAEVCPPARPDTEGLLLEGSVDCAWMYRPWEVLRARKRSIGLRQFRPPECGVPFAYMNTLVISKARVAGLAGRDMLRRFLSAAAEGAAWAAADPRRAGRLLAKMAQAEGQHGFGVDSGLGDPAFNGESIQLLVDLGGLVPPEGCRWGEMEHGRWSAFLAWAEGRAAARARGEGEDEGGVMQLLGHAMPLDAGALFTNEFLSPSSLLHT